MPMRRVSARDPDVRAGSRAARAERRAAFLARFPEENPDPVLRLDRSQAVLYANSAARARLRELGLVVGGAAPAALAEPAREAARARQGQKAEIRCGETTFSMRFVPIEDEVNVYAQDITARVQAEQALREASRRKDEFLAMLSHELRNPLAPIASSVYVLRHTDPAGEVAARALGVIERQTRHLTRLVDDLLDVTRIARGKVELRRSHLDLRDVVSRAADDFRVLMQARGIAFEVALPEGELWAVADGTRITQIVGNLLHNAAKYTRRGDRVLLALAAAGAQAEVRVRDTGVGIDPELLPHVFDPFVQGDRSLARSEGGLGLGLALVKGIAELHGGRVEARSGGRGRGAEIMVSLPLAERP